MTEKPNDGDLRYAMDSTQDSRFQSIRILRQYRIWADEQIAQLQERNANQAKSVAELREETDNLRDDNAKHRNDYRLRGEQLAELTAERDNFRDQANAAINRQIELREKYAEAARVNDRQQQAISRMADRLNQKTRELEKSRVGTRNLTAERNRLLREVTELRAAEGSKPSTVMHEYAETAFAKKIAMAKMSPAELRDTEAKPDHKSRILEAAYRDFAGLSPVTQRYLVDWATGATPKPAL